MSDTLYEVEKILDKKKVMHEGKKKLCYEVKWVGYPSSQNTWEPVEAIKGTTAAEKFEAKKTPTAKSSKSIKKNKPAVRRTATKHHQNTPAQTTQATGNEVNGNKTKKVAAPPKERQSLPVPANRRIDVNTDAQTDETQAPASKKKKTASSSDKQRHSAPAPATKAPTRALALVTPPPIEVIDLVDSAPGSVALTQHPASTGHHKQKQKQESGLETGKPISRVLGIKSTPAGMMCMVHYEDNATEEMLTEVLHDRAPKILLAFYESKITFGPVRKGSGSSNA